jgi:nucleotide-binding universal stress UspA family protein
MRGKLEIRRILVALDASPDSLAALEAAAKLARHLQAELVGLYVEDINVLRVAERPFARQVTFAGDVRSVKRGELEAQFRTQAESARSALARVANRSHLRWSFRVSRGQIATELIAATPDMDLITLARLGGSPLARRGLGRTARAVLAEATLPVLLLGRQLHLALPALVLFDDSAAAETALALGFRLWAEKTDSLVVLLASSSSEEIQRLKAAARKLLVEAGGKEPRFRIVFPIDASQLSHACTDEGAGVLILPGPSNLFSKTDFETLLVQLEVPILLVR